MAEGFPFTLTEGLTLDLADLFGGGKTTGPQTGLTVRWTGLQLTQMNHSASPVTMQGTDGTTYTLAELFSMDPIAAAGGTTQATATLITARTTLFVAVNPTAGGRMPASAVGALHTIWNMSAVELTIWPGFGEFFKIGPAPPLAANAPVAIAPGAAATIVCNTVGSWKV